MRILILGGTSEASALARRVRDMPDVEATLSLAGRTERPAVAPIPARTGGFGGVAGFVAYLRSEKIAAVVDATHAFARQISASAVEACAVAKIPLVGFTRPPWSAVEGDRWTTVDDVEAAADAIGVVARRVFLTVGRLRLGAFAAAPQHDYLVRTIDPPAGIEALPTHRSILARGPFSVEDELTLMQSQRIEVLVSKNSGGSATYPKIEAARRLHLPVVMIDRPPAISVTEHTDLAAVVDWIEAHRPSP